LYSRAPSRSSWIEHDHAERNVRRPKDALFARCM
jgi:hypothetical protein